MNPMMDKISILIFGITIGASLGAIMMLAMCSRRPLCPRSIERRLRDWNKRVERETTKRRGLLEDRYRDDDPPDEAA